ncbi:unnamed protein product [marine sediment metagenome]|uniref:Uncharacterized protein n=1 Tax=marine sediment metagenome TaxID=412755 RepID=X1D086_9ZZZZ
MSVYYPTLVCDDIVSDSVISIDATALTDTPLLEIICDSTGAGQIVTLDNVSVKSYSDGLGLRIDGKEDTLTYSGSLPTSMNGSLLDLYINHNLEGYATNIAKNYGYISDIFMLNVANSSEADIQRVVNDGVEYLVDDNYINTYVEKSNIYFNDPDTITVTSTIDDMSYVYMGRNDGKILRGSPLMWQTRRTFATDEEVELLDLSSDDITSTGFLELKDKSVRL